MANPPIKWVGGKRQLLPELVSRLPKEPIVDYHEPFLGGGALFFHIKDSMLSANLSDVNPELINVYKAIKHDVHGLIKELSLHQNTEEHFLQIRDVDRQTEYDWRWSPIQKAARFIYLNKTCFNGLYRVNSKGQFNVPFGHYANPKILDEENLLECHKALQGVSIECRDFQSTYSELLARDWPSTLFYFDPPYIPLSATSSFTQYSKDGFSIRDHHRLYDHCVSLDVRGIKWMQSNSSSKLVYEIYRKFHIEEVEVRRSVGSSKESRAPVKELIIRNYDK